MPAAKSPAKIPEDITCDRKYRDGINNILKHILADLQKLTRAEEMFVNCRLNRSDQKISPAPVCVGWAESKALEKKRKNLGLADPAIMRFGDDHLSPVYAECLCDANMDVKARDYSKSETAVKEKVVGSRGYDVALRQVYRRYVCIRAGGCRVGTLTVGSRSRPSNYRELEDALRDWAQNPQKELVKYLEKNVELGGPPQ
jgi:hypothetical protein